jgi:L-threonylcarbamoyladenylate synthase
MQRITVDPNDPDPRVIASAAKVLRDGGLVAFPTETVYGLGAHALDPIAVAKIYAAKGRPAYNPIIVHVANRDLVSTVARAWNDAAETLANVFWPGPLTIVLPRRPEVPDAVTAGLDTVGVRVPRHPVAYALMVAAGIPIAAPSANQSMAVSPTTGAHVAKSLGDSIDLILDGGPTSVGIESTVVDLSRKPPVLLRPGTISVPELEALIGPIELALHNSASQGGGAPRPSPGMLDKHYSPRAPLDLVDATELTARIENAKRSSQRVGAIVIDAERGLTGGEVKPIADAYGASVVYRLPSTARGYAAILYDALHALDDAGVDLIVVQRPPNSAAWLGVRDRLERAAR